MQENVEKIDKTGEETKAPVSTREAIRAAIDEEKSKLEQQDDKQDKQVDEKLAVLDKPAPVVEGDKEDKKEEIKASTKIAGKKVEAKDPEQLELPLGDKKVEPKVEESKKESKAPFGLTKEIRAKWSTYDPETQGYFSKLLKDSLDLKAEAGRNAYLRDVGTVLTPYLPELQKFGATPAQLVKRLLEYSDALGSQQYKYAAIAKLANDFGIDLTLFGKQDQDDKNQNKNNQQQSQLQYQDYIPPEVDQKLDTILGKFNQLEAQQQDANSVAARDYVNTWAGFDLSTGEFTKKPYLPHVRRTMHQLIASGSIPIVDNTVDLDAAYEAACFMNPEIRELMAEDQNKAIAQANEQRRQEQIKAAQKAKLAGSSIRTGAPVPITDKPINSKNNSGKPMSVRDSIRLALSEARDA